MLIDFFVKLFALPKIIRMAFFPKYNRLYFKSKKISYGYCLNVLGKVSVAGAGKITIGDNFCMTNGDHINPISANIQGSFYTDCTDTEICIGDNVGMSSTRMWIHNKLTIGNNVKIGACVLLIDTDTHPIDYEVRRTSNEGTKSAPIVIEDDVWIGAHSIVLKGVTIGARSIIGAGSVVTKDIPSDCVAAGNPCNVIRYLHP